MRIDDSTTVGETIAKNFRTAPLFLGYQIDLLTERDKTIGTVCKDHHINLLHLINDLNAVLVSSGTPSSDYSAWPLRLLTDLITIRHRYVKENLPVIQQFLDRLSEVHEGNDQHIVDFCTSFNTCAERLMLFLQRQVPVLFSLIKQMIRTEKDNGFSAELPFETVGSAIKKMTDELSFHKKSFLSVVGLISRYVPPLNAYNYHKITLDLLAELQDDLYKIIGLQNVLYMRVMDMENKPVMNH